MSCSREGASPATAPGHPRFADSGRIQSAEVHSPHPGSCCSVIPAKTLLGPVLGSKHMRLSWRQAHEAGPVLGGKHMRLALS